MSIFRRRIESKQRLDHTEALLIQAAETADAREPQINRLSDFLVRRNNTNGFGQDFELTLIPKGTR